MEKENHNLTAKILSHIQEKEARAFVYEQIATMALSIKSEDFAEILKQISNYEDGIEMLKNNWKIILNNSQNPIQILDVYKDIPEISKLVIENVPYLIKYMNISDTGIIAKKLLEFENGSNAIAQNFDGLLMYARTNLSSIFIPALCSKEGIDKIRKNFNEIKNEPDIKDFFRFIKAIKHVEELQKEYEEYKFWADLYDDIELPRFKEISNDELISLEEFEEQNKKQRIITNKDRIFKEIISSEDKYEKELILKKVANGNRYTFKSGGYTSIVIQAGTQIAKLGTFKFQYRVPYHPRLMMPYFRKEYNDDSVLEVYNLGNTKSTNITSEEILRIYKELESAGIIWADAKKDNVLVLLEDNELPPFIRSEDFNLFGFLEDDRFPTNNHKALKAGDIVICDLDCLYPKDDPDIEYCMDIDSIVLEYIQSKEQEQNNLEDSSKCL